MSQASQLVDLLKQALRDREMRYADLARGLGVSESSVKRLFSKRRLSLERLEAICTHLGLEISDLLELAQAADKRVSELSEEQERALAADEKLLLVGVLALGHFSLEEMVAAYRLARPEAIRLLARLDKLGMIDLLPGNRIKLRLARNFRWRPGGPLERLFEKHMQKQFFESSFHGEGEKRYVVHGALSERSNAMLLQRMAKLAEEFDALAEEDRRLDRRALKGTTLVMAIRPWELAVFSALRRSGSDHEGGLRGQTSKQITVKSVPEAPLRGLTPT